MAHDHTNIPSPAPHTPTSPDDDPIITEVRAVREAQFAAASDDLAEYVRRLREVEATSGHPVIDGRPGPVRDPAA